MNSTAFSLKPKPLLRGYLHEAAFFAALGAGVLLIARADAPVARMTVLIYVAGLAVVFGISALYHRPTWSERGRRTMRKLDHAGIFVQIAASCTPFCLWVLGGESGRTLLTLVLVGSLGGLAQSLFWLDAPKWIPTLLGIGIGALSLPYLAELRAVLDPLGFKLLWGGGLVYAVGGIIYAFKRPDPWPKVFGYHEIFHLLVVVAAAMHFAAIYQSL